MRKNLLPILLLCLAGLLVSYRFWSTSTQESLPTQSGASSSTATSVPANQPALKGDNTAGTIQPTSAASNIAYDPRLANLAVAADNPMVEYVRGEGGVVIAEIDNDPNNISYKKPLKEYQYQQGRVRTLTRYDYYKAEIIITTIDAAYKADGSLLDYREQTVTKKLE